MAWWQVQDSSEPFAGMDDVAQCAMCVLHMKPSFLPAVDIWHTAMSVLIVHLRER